MTLYQSLKYAVREICRGSGVINLATIGIATIILYIIFGYILNRNVFHFLIDIESEIEKNEGSLRIVLERLSYYNMHQLLIPIINVVIFMETPIKEQINNQLIRILPISPSVRLLSIVISIAFLAIASLLLILIIDFGILQYIRSNYTQQLIDLQEGAGILHSQLDNINILSTNFNDFYLASLSEKLVVIFYAIVYGLLRLNLLQFFNNYAFAKSFLIIGILVFIINKISFSLFDLGGLQTQKVQVESPIYIFIFIIATILLILSSYYTFKEREE